MNTKKYNELDQAIRKVCSETIELKFGCKYRYRAKCSDIEEDWINEIVTKESIEFDTTNYDLEILGTSLGLAEVLRAIPDIYIRLSKPFILIMDYQTKKDVSWNLTKNLFQNCQDNPKLLEFLHGVIVKNCC